MKILILSPRLPHSHSFSGMQIVYQRMTRLMRRGHEVGVACFLDKTHDEPYLDRMPSDLLDLEVVRDPFLNRFLPSPFTSGRYSAPSSFFRYHSRRLGRRVGEMVLKNGYDVVLAEFSAMGQCFHRNPYLPAVRRILSCHDSPTLGSRRQIDAIGANLNWGRQWLEYRHMRYLEFSLYHAADRVLTLTDEERIDLLEEDPNLGITTVTPGLNCETFQPVPDLPKEHCIVITGRFSSEQSHFGGLWFLRNVWPLVRSRDAHVKLYMVGRDPSSAMRHLAKKDDRLIITGTVQDLRPFLTKSKVYVCPVLSGSGIRGKILEAMAMSLPVVTTSVGSEGIPLDQGDNAYRADAPDMMADFIHMLLHDPEHARRVGARARQTIETHFNWDQSMDLLEKVLSEAVAKRSYHLVS